MTTIFVLKDRSTLTARPPVMDTGSMPPIQNSAWTAHFCPCVQSQNHMKLIHLHVSEGYLDEAGHLWHTPQHKEIYVQRKETIERVFADAKEKHGMRWTTPRGLGKLSMQAMLTFAAMNLKKLASWSWKSPRPV